MTTKDDRFAALACFACSFRRDLAAAIGRVCPAAYIAAILSAHFLAAPAFSQSDAHCVEAASLWLPSSRTPTKEVTKWQKQREISFAIISKRSDSQMVKLIEAELDFVSRQTGLKFHDLSQLSDAPLPDLLVMIDPSVIDDGPKLREVAQQFFGHKLGRSFHINSDGWSASIEKTSPKCIAADFETGDKSNVAFLIVQENETQACIRIGVSEAFGVVDARNYYAENNQTISEAVVGQALAGLYSDTIRSGMGRAEALKQVEEDCKK